MRFRLLSRIALLAAFSAVSATLGAQEISGVIINREGEAVFHAMVQVVGSGLGATSDESGFYRIEKITPGPHTLIFSHLNHESDTVSVTVEKDRTLTLNRQLADRVSALDEVEVVGKTESQEAVEKPFEVTVIDVQPLQQRNIDLTRILNHTSGIRIRQNAGLGSSFDLTLNGFTAAQFIDGIPAGVYGTAYGFNSIPTSWIQGIEVFKGVVPVHLSADALGGAVNIITKESVRNDLNLVYSYGSFNTHKASVQGSYRNPVNGFTLRGSTFLNYSDNDYVMKDMEIISGTTSYKKDVRRFHDNFQSYATKAEVGFTANKFADALLLGVGFSGIDREIQTGSSQYPPIGEATGDEDNHHISLRYRNFSLLKSKLETDAFLILNNTRTTFIDTASRTYQWDGSVLVHRPSTTQSGEFDDKEIYKTKQKSLTQRYNISYHVSDIQLLTVNIFSDVTDWKNTDPGKIEGTSIGDNSNRYSKLIVGLEHDLKLFDGRLQSVAFVKYYRMNADIDSASRWRGGYFDRVPMRRNKSFKGGGLGLSFAVSEKLLIKTSAEYACRLPTIYEFLGDGITTVANVSLKPEQSKNFNLGFTARLVDKPFVTLTATGSGFLRKAKDFIQPTTGVRRSTFINYAAAFVRGAEAEVKLMIIQKLGVRINGTYQQVLDDNKYVGGTLKNYSYRVQLPNRPSLFGNVDMEYKIRGIFNDRFNLAPYYSLLYVKEFYLGYENIARGNLKYTIPMQLVHDIGLTLSKPSEQYSFSVECSNVTDAAAFDNFRLQKPGRAFSFKITYNLNSRR